MCGIVGYVGHNKAQPYLISGLHRLEYRGYDSAGIVTLDKNGKPKLIRAKGKVLELEKIMEHNLTDDTIGIGHTRWATHGEPSEVNAHPHRAGDVFLVHNGIIENYKELKDHLNNFKFVTQTDTEILAALIDSFYDEKTNLVDAVRQALSLVRGTYGIAVLSIREPDQIVVARLGSPLIIGVGNNETYIASDASALIGYTKQVIYLNDGEVAVCKKDSVDITNSSSKPVSKKVEEINVDMQAIQKQGYDHFLLKEICEQPQTLTATLSGRIDKSNNSVKLSGLNMSPSEIADIEHIVIVGCGTAYYAGLLGMYYIEKLVGDITVDVITASEYRYRSFYLPKNSVALIVSQSGETADTLACLREIKDRGVKTIGIVNVVGSTISREVDGGIYVHAGPEISVASTKAFTSQVSAIVMFGILATKSKGRDGELVNDYISELEALPKEIQKVIDDNLENTKKIAKKYAKYDNALYFGRDTLYPVALEGALKLKEISYIHAEGYAAGELKHGPIALIDDRFFEVALLMDNWLFEKSQSAVSEVAARNGHVLAITNSDKNITAESIIRIKTKLKIFTPILINIIQQLFAYYVAVHKGNDVDQPRNLAKSVTVE